MAFYLSVAGLDKFTIPNNAYIFDKFQRNEPAEGKLQTKHQFIASLMNNLNKRNNAFAKCNAENIDDYNHIIRQNKKYRPMPYMVVFIDNIIDIAVSNRTRTGLYLIRLLMTGASAGMYFVAASVGSYRNLLMQLINIDPAITRHFERFAPASHFKITNPLGAELVINPDGLYFFKERNKAEYLMLYPIKKTSPDLA